MKEENNFTGRLIADSLRDSPAFSGIQGALETAIGGFGYEK
jgi:hypothetical protein